MTTLGLASLPINPIKIATDNEIEVQSWEPKKAGVSGFFMKSGDAFGIGYSRFFDNKGFINFTVGHELGHYFLPGHVEKLFAAGDGVHHSKSGFVSSDECEREADLFSATFLMPKSLFMRAARQSGEGFPAIQKLAGVCETSITATSIRFAECAEDPVAVIVGSAGRVDFWCASPVICDWRGLTWLKAGDLIPASSTTARFQADALNISRGATAEGTAFLDEWFEGAPRIEMKEDVVGLGNYGKSLTVLFTTEPLEEDEEEDEEKSYLPSWRR